MYNTKHDSKLCRYSKIVATCYCNQQKRLMVRITASMRC